MDANLIPDHRQVVTTLPPASGSTWIRLLLEDDRDLWQILVVALGPRRPFHSISQRLRFGVAVGVFLLVMGLVIQAVDSQEYKAIRGQGKADAPAQTSASSEKTSPKAAPSDSASQQVELRPLVSSAGNDQNFTFGSIDSISNGNPTGASQSENAGSLAQNNTAANGPGGSATSGSGGAASEVKSASAASQQSVSVPETSPTALLLGTNLLALFGLRVLFRRRIPQSC